VTCELSLVTTMANRIGSSFTRPLWSTQSQPQVERSLASNNGVSKLERRVLASCDYRPRRW